jgi:colanic acid/amylovoran biosynthesis glycosyltransferase
MSWKPAVDFETGWLQTLRAEADVFVCCHPQGDPSSTYPEVMSCGVPIIGFANPAWAGIAAMTDGGWVVPVGDCKAMAAKLAELSQRRDEIASAAARARAFGMEHVFESTFSARVRHLLAGSRLDEHTRHAALARLSAP